MSQNPINVEVFDHQGLATISTVTIEAPDLFSGEASLSLSTQTGEESWLFSGFIVNELEAVHRSYPLLVKVLDTDSDQNLGQINAWDVSSARVKEGWARTWGGERFQKDLAEGRDVAVDNTGNIYITGSFGVTVDFDPGSGVDSHSAPGGNVFLSKFNESGQFLWTRTWGGDGNYLGDDAWALAIDDLGNVYVTGSFEGIGDFNPGTDVDEHESNGKIDIFLSKFSSDGDFIWAKTWGGMAHDEGLGVSVDSIGHVYVTGYFEMRVDFDPGDGLDNHVSNGYSDIFLSKFDSAGNYIWARTWGGDLYYPSDAGYDVAIYEINNIHVAGYFKGLVDFNPGAGEDLHESTGEEDAFLCKFNSDGEYIWGRTWGGSDSDVGISITSDRSGNLCIAGSFRSTADFDPGPGEDTHESHEGRDIFLSRFNSDGTFNWARTWGGWDFITGTPMPDVAVDWNGNAYVTSYFRGTADFDPGDGVDNHTSIGISDVFLSKFNPAGDFVWARILGGDDWDDGLGVTVDSSGNIYCTGFCSGNADLDPGPGEDIHVCLGYRDAYLIRLLPDGYW